MVGEVVCEVSPAGIGEILFCDFAISVAGAKSTLGIFAAQFVQGRRAAQVTALLNILHLSNSTALRMTALHRRWD
jgi:hypothetical protein